MLQLNEFRDGSLAITQWPYDVLLPGTKPIDPINMDYIADVTPVFIGLDSTSLPFIICLSSRGYGDPRLPYGYIVKDGADLPHDGRLYPIIGVEGLSFLYAKSHGGPHADS